MVAPHQDNPHQDMLEAVTPSVLLGVFGYAQVSEVKMQFAFNGTLYCLLAWHNLYCDCNNRRCTASLTVYVLLRNGTEVELIYQHRCVRHLANTSMLPLRVVDVQQTMSD
jgi:hypothetical protein